MRRAHSILLLLMLATTVGFAQGIGLKGVGGGVGYASISFTSGGSTETLSGFALSGHADLGEITSGVSLYPELQYFSASKDFGAGLDWSVSDVAINANAHYNFKVQGSVAPYVGAGLGLNFLSSTVKISIPFFGTTEVTGSDTKLGINLLGGAGYALNKKTSLFAEARYVLVSDFSHFVIKAGVTIGL